MHGQGTARPGAQGLQRDPGPGPFPLRMVSGKAALARPRILGHAERPQRAAEEGAGADLGLAVDAVEATAADPGELAGTHEAFADLCKSGVGGEGC